MNLLVSIKEKMKWVIINDKALSPNVKLSFEHYYLRRIERKNDNELVFFNTTEQALEYSLNQGYEYCLINWEGILIKNQPEYVVAATNHIDNLNKKGKWLVTGQCIDDVSSINFWNAEKVAEPGLKWYYLWPITAIVNLKVWQELGKPYFGRAGRYHGNNLPAVLRSSENIHDTYTPLWISSADSVHSNIEDVETKHGWNILKISLDNKLTVYNIPEPLRQETEYTYPENDIETYNKTIEFIQNSHSNKLDFKLIKTMLDMSNRMNHTTFNAFNSEGLSPAIEIEHYHRRYADIDTIVYPTQGFKDFIYSFSNVCHSQHIVNFVHYDLTLDAVKKRKYFIENWDLTLDFIIDNKFVNFGQDWNSGWKELLSHFDDEEHLKQQWEKYKNCNHYYVDQNLMHEVQDQKIKRQLDKIKSNRVLLMYSDIFPWESNLLVRGIENLERMEKELINHIKQDRHLVLVESKGVVRHIPEFKLYI